MKNAFRQKEIQSADLLHIGSNSLYRWFTSRESSPGRLKSENLSYKIVISVSGQYQAATESDIAATASDIAVIEYNIAATEFDIVVTESDITATESDIAVAESDIGHADIINAFKRCL